MASVKEAITVRLEPAQGARLRVVAREQNRSLTNYVESAILRDLHAGEAELQANSTGMSSQSDSYFFTFF